MKKNMVKKIFAALLLFGMFCFSLFKMPVDDNADNGMYICCSNLSDDFH